MAGEISGKQLRDASVDTTQMAAGVLEATSTGRALMASGLFDEATVDDKFAASAIDTDRLKEGSLFIQSGGGVAMAAALAMGTNKITGLSDGTASSDAATKGQLDAVAAGLDPKASSECATTGILSTHGTTPAYAYAGGTGTRGQITWASGPTTIDGYSLVNGDRIIVKNEGSGTTQVSSVDTRADSSGDLNDDYFVIYATPRIAYYVWYNVNSAGSDPTPSPPAGVSYTGAEVAVATNATAGDVADATKVVLDALLLNGYAPFGTISIASLSEMTIPNTFGGLCTDVAEGVGTTFTFATDTPGTGLGPDVNGIWVRTGADTWDRATDFDTDAEVTTGAYSFVSSGTVSHDIGYIVTSHDPLICGGAGGSPIIWATFTSVSLGGTPGTIQPDDAANEGTSGSAARSDHQHAIVAAAPGTTAKSEATSAAEGSATSFMRSDAQIEVATATPGTAIQSDAGTALQGAASTLLRSDALILAATAAPVAVGTANAQGSSTSLSRADHVHDSPAPTAGNKFMTANVTAADQAKATDTTVAATPALDSYVKVEVNGIGYQVGDTGTFATSECYFGQGDSVTGRAIADIASGDTLRWNGTVAGFELDANDRIDFFYVV